MSTTTVCDGSRNCQADVHVHGCFCDFGACDEPEEHGKSFGSRAEPSVVATATHTSNEGEGMTVTVDAQKAAELLGVDVYTLAVQLREASAARFESIAKEISRAGYERGEDDPLDLSDDIEGAINLLRAAEACEAEWRGSSVA